MSRREFSAKVKAAAFERAAGRCEGTPYGGERCPVKLQPGRFAYDHIIADSIGGEPTLDNCAVLCRACHDEKTRTLDTPRAAKTKRQKLAHIGARPSSRMAGSRSSPFKKLMNGQTVRRNA